MLRKRILLLILLLALCLCLPAAAYDTQRQLDLVVDAAGLLTPEQLDGLNARAEALSAQYGCEVIAVTVGTLGGSTVGSFAESVYLDYGYGYGPDKSGVMLLLSMEDRDYDILAYGYGNTAFTDYGKDQLEDRFLPALGRDDWYGGLSAYIDACGDYLEAAAQGRPIDIAAVQADPGAVLIRDILLALVIGFVPALVTVLIMRGSMKSAKLQRTADQYMEPRGVYIHLREDQFLRKDVRRIRRDPPSSGGSRGGTSVNSRGFSHRSGKF